MHIKLSATFASRIYDPCKVRVFGFRIRRFSNNNIQWLTAIRGDDIWVAFAGTNEMADWLENLDVRKIKTPYGSLHAGFCNAAKEIEDDIDRQVAHRPWKNITFCGHSLGGAIAVVTAARYMHLLPNVKLHLHTFGQPRVGDAKWVSNVFKDWENSYIRVVNAGDIVPHLPTFIRFRHSGQVVFFDADHTVVNPTWQQRAMAGFNAMTKNRKSGLVSLSKHSMDSYLKNVLKIPERRNGHHNHNKCCF
ncbi:MAG: lipase family protein [Magnetococcales bacterium]|nr:lipase family protein [Magnetococcales bacterium]